jgi:hypothetical protein
MHNAKAHTDTYTNIHTYIHIHIVLFIYSKVVIAMQCIRELFNIGFRLWVDGEAIKYEYQSNATPPTDDIVSL